MSQSDPTVSIDLKAKTLTIVLPLQEATPSKSGKTLVIASTYGNMKTATKHNGGEVTIGVNAYIPNPKRND